MKKLILSLLAGAAIATSINAQDAESSPLTLSGSVDTYYRTTLNTSDGGASAATASSFADGTGFNIGMFNLIASKEGEKSGFVADVVVGPRGAAAGTNEDALGVVNQLYGYWNINDMFTLTAGRFNTFLGYEVISPSANFNYSTSYMFSWGPFTHTGAKLDIAATDELSFMVAALDNVDYFGDKSQNNLMLGLQAGYELENGGIWLNYLGGNTGIDGAEGEAYHQVDLTTGFNWTEDLYLGFNGTFATQGLGNITQTAGTELPETSGFFGLAGYAQYTLSDAIAIGGRAEYFSDKNGFVGLPAAQESLTDFNTSGAVVDLTLSANISVGDLTFIPEVRADFFLDAIDDAAAPVTDGSAFGVDKAGDLTKALGSFSIAAVYTF